MDRGLRLRSGHLGTRATNEAEEEARVLVVPLGELVADLETNGLDAAGSELGLDGVEATAVRRYHLHDHPIDAALRNLPDHLRCPASSSVASRLRSAGQERKAGRSRRLGVWL